MIEGLAAGAKLGPYEILARIGAGGMGEVWKARDTRLDRIVAIKTIRGAFSDRFRREAKTIASLNHPHICTLFDIGETPAGENYLVLEYIEGRPLSGPRPLAQVLNLAAQMAEALADAHGHEVVHRDLKPANVLVTKAGVKLLDFGLAKSIGGEDGETLTVAGAVMGTPLYMAPEQRQGKEADKRSDIYAFGATLYELVTGRRAAEGLQKIEPAALDRVVRRCMEQDPENRWQSAADLAEMMRTLAAGMEAPAKQKPRRPWVWMAATALAVIVVAAALLAWLYRPASIERTLHLNITPPEGTRFTIQGSAISPDGRHLAFAGVHGGRTVLFIRPLDKHEARMLEGTDDASFPFWSPDSQSIAFFANGKLKRMELNGVEPRTLCDASASSGGAWSSATNEIIFPAAFNSSLSRVPASGGIPQPLTRLDASKKEVSHRLPAFLPDGRHFLYLARSSGIEENLVYLTTLEESAQGRPPVRLTQSTVRPVFAPDPDRGHGLLLFGYERTLMAQPLDWKARRLLGEPVPVEGVVAISFTGIVGFADLSASDQGLLAAYDGGVRNRIVRRDRSGAELRSIGPFLKLSSPRVSPDGRFLLVAGGRPGSFGVSVFLADLDRGSFSRFHGEGNAIAQYPAWSSDGKTVYFSSTEKRGVLAMYRRPLSGESAALQFSAGLAEFAQDCSRDGRFLLYAKAMAETGFDILALPLTEGAKPIPILQSRNDEMHGQFSPDGHWVAYTSNESGVSNVYVTQFLPDNPAAARQWMISMRGGSQPRWRGDGREIFFLSPDGKMMVAGIRTLPTGMEPGVPQSLFDANVVASIFNTSSFDVAADGQSFFIISPVETGNQEPIHILYNWQKQLRK